MPYRQVGLICPSESVHFLVDYLKKLRYDVRALWTPEPELTIQAAAEYEIPFSASRPDEVLLKKEVQMIIITGRPQIHSQIAVKALGIGKHVLCDSPVTLNRSDALKMVQAAQYYPQLVALVGFGLRHLDTFRRARELIANGYVGALIACECSVRSGPLLLADHFDWLWEHSMGGGVLNLVGCHVIDVISYLTKRRATRVQGLVKCSGLAAADGRGYSEEANGNDFLWTNGDSASASNGGEEKDELRPGSGTGASVGFRRANAEDFASFLLKFDNDFVATITLNALSESITSNSNIDRASTNGSNSSPPTYFHQRISISGTEGQLEIQDQDIYGIKFRSTCINETATTNCSPTSAGVKELIFSGSDAVGETTSTINEQKGYVVHTVVPDLYVRGFLNLLRLLAEALPTYEQQQKQNGATQSRKQSSIASWQTGCLAVHSLASFEDAQYVRAVIDAVRHSSEKGDWVKVDIKQHEDPIRNEGGRK